MSKLPFLPLYVNDFISDTQDLTDEEVGCYIRLLMYQWKQARLPAQLKRISVFASSIDRSWPELKKHFIEKDGYLYNERVEKERSKAIGTHILRSEAGKKGGGRAKAGNKASDKPGLSPDISPEQASYISDSRSHIPESKTRKTENRKQGEPPISPQGETPPVQELYTYWIKNHSANFKLSTVPSNSILPKIREYWQRYGLDECKAFIDNYWATVKSGKTAELPPDKYWRFEFESFPFTPEKAKIAKLSPEKQEEYEREAIENAAFRDNYRRLVAEATGELGEEQDNLLPWPSTKTGKTKK